MPSAINRLHATARLLTACAVLPLLPAHDARAASPLSATLGPDVTVPVHWAGTATAPAGTSPATSCREGLDCDTFVINFGGTTANWSGKAARISIGWQLPASDYDLYILRQTPSGAYILGQSAAYPPNLTATAESLHF